VTRENLVACALAASLAVRSEEQGREVLEGRRTAVSPFLPSNPTLSLSAAHRAADGSPQTAFNWSATLGQELEIGGQRGARRRAVEQELEAQGGRILVQRRQAAAAAWIAFFDALAAGEELRLARDLETVTARVATVTRAMADKGLLSGVEADIADASLLAVQQGRFAAERRDAVARAGLANLLGLDPAGASIDVQGDLVPLAGVLEQGRAALGRDGTERPEVHALDAERRAAEARAEAFRRARVPNVTVSVTAQSDGFDERVFGAGLAIPLPLPQPVGRTYAGEIAEANASARRTQIDVERIRRAIRLELIVALQAFESRQKEREAFTPERVTRAREGIDSIAAEVQTARLSVRDAVVAQQSLIGLLRAHIEAKRAASIASVDLARAAGMPLEGGAR
jgi:cobalt-zinc-cadmium efflux system outer membrane protein